MAVAVSDGGASGWFKRTQPRAAERRPAIPLQPENTMLISLGTGGQFNPTPDTRKHVEQLASVGMSLDQIADILKITRNTLRKHCGVEFERGVAGGIASVAQRLYKTATTGVGAPAVTAAIFFLRSKGGWSENPTIDGYKDEAETRKAAHEAIDAKFKAIIEAHQNPAPPTIN